MEQGVQICSEALLCKLRSLDSLVGNQLHRLHALCSGNTLETEQQGLPVLDTHCLGSLEGQV